MSTAIDERIVEMRFDRQQFREGVNDTINDLSKLNAALHKTDSAKAFDGIEKSIQNVNLNGIAAGVEALQKRFSIFGLVGIKAVNGVANSVVGLFHKLYKVTIGQVVSGGIKRAMNMENAHFQLQALLKDEEKVQAVMNDANKAVDGTAYSLDAAAKAASQFAATGIQAGDEMLGALRGIVGVSAMTNSDFESISMIFTTVAGQGRVMGDQLNQLAARGLNASATMAEFVNGVNDGSKQASEEVTKLVKTFSNGTKLTEGDIRELVSKGKISFKLFSEAMTEAFADSAEKANETFTGSLSNVKSALSRIGAGFISPLIAQNSEIVNLFNAIRLKINEFKKAIVFDEEVGNVMAVSKQFTDFVLKSAEALRGFINNIDTPTAMRNFYYGLETVKNVFKALWVLVKPALMALSGLINPINDGLYTLLVALEAITSKMIASEGVSNAIGEVLREIVSIFGTLISMGFKVIQGVLKPFTKETESTSNGFVNLLKSISNVLKIFNNWLNTSPTVNSGLKAMSKVLTSVVRTLRNIVKAGSNVIKSVKTSIKIITDFIGSFDGIDTISGKIENIGQKISELFNIFKKNKSNVSLSSTKETIPVLTEISNSLESVSENFAKSTSKIPENLKIVTENVSSFMKVMKESAVAFVDFVAKLNLSERIIPILNATVTIIGKLADAMTEMYVAFSQNATNEIILGLAVIVLYLTLVAKRMTGIGKVFTETVGIFGKIGKGMVSVLGQSTKTLKAFSRDLNASAILKISGAILVLSGALFVLSLVDPVKVVAAATGLAIAGGVLLGGLTAFTQALNKTKTLYDVMNNVVTQIGKSIRTKAIGEAFKSIGLSFLMVAGSIIAIAIAYERYEGSMDKAVKLIGAIGLVFVGLLTTMSILGKVVGSGMKSFASAAIGIAAISGSIMLIVMSLNRLFKMELPYDYSQKLDILYGIMLSLASMTAFLTLVSNLGHGGKANTIPILHMFISLHAVISALGRLFKMDLPYDYKKKLSILYSILTEISMMIAVLGLSGRIAGGPIKAGGTILALSVFLTTVVVALSILTLFPSDKILKACMSLGTIFVALGVSINLASKYSNKYAATAIFNMAVLIGSLVGAIGILTLFDPKNIVRSTLALSVALVAVGKVIENASTIKDWQGVAAFVASIAVIGEMAYSLYILSKFDWKSVAASGVAMAIALKSLSDAFETISELEESADVKTILKFTLAAVSTLPLGAALIALSHQPWDGMLASGVALGMALKAFAEAFSTISEAEEIDVKQVGKFILAATSSIVLGLALGVLAHQPWGGMLAAGVAMSATLMAFGKAFQIMSTADDVDVKQVGSFLLASLAVIPIGLALGVISHQPWDGMLGSAVAMSATLLALSGCFAIISKYGTPDLKTAGGFALASLALIPIALGLKIVAQEDWKGLLGAATSLSVVLLALSVVMNICAKVGPVAGYALAGLGVLALFIIGLTILLGAIGGLVDFFGAGDAILRGLEVVNQIGLGLGTAIGNFIGGIASGISSRLGETADNLTDFMNRLMPFVEGLKGISTDSINGIMMFGEMLKSLTTSELIQGITKFIGGSTDFALLGEQLNLMAPYLKTFSEGVTGINPDSVAGAKVVSEIMVALADSLPRVGGVIDKVMGKKKSLTEFAAELSSFGPEIKKFSEIVKDVKPEAVEGAAAAGAIMAELGEQLPKSDGLVQKIFGDKTLSEFGAELVPFGLYIRAFATVVKDVKPEAVEGAANAGAIMARMAQQIPNSGGVLGWLMGENDIDKFGEKLVSFGNSMVTFSSTVSGLNPFSVLGVSMITKMMASLAESLPDTGDVFDVFTGGTMDFKKFGTQLEAFGKSLAKYSDTISTLNTAQIIMTTGSLKSLIDLLLSAQGVEQDAFSNFALALSSLPATATNEFVSGFQNGSVLVIGAINDFFSDVNGVVTVSISSMTETARVGINAMALAIAVYLPFAFSKTKDSMIKIGEFVGEGLAIGIGNKMSRVRTAASDMAKLVEDTVSATLMIRSPSRVAMKLGGYWNEGFAKGLTQNADIIRTAVKRISVEDIIKFTQNLLGIHSPSRKSYEMGVNWNQGWANGVTESSNLVTNAGRDMVQRFSDEQKEAVEELLPESLKSVSDLMEKTSDALGKGKDKLTEEIKNSKVYEVYGEKWKDEGNKLIDTLSQTLGLTAGVFKKNDEEILETQKTYHAKSIKQEETYWENLLKIKKAGADGAKYKDMKFAEFQKQILSETMEVWKEYTDQLNSTRDGVMTTMDLFAEVTKNESVKSKEDLRKNLSDQIKAYKEYAELLQTLNGRIGESELGKYLTTLGVDSLDQLKVINSMTDDELTEYAQLYDTKLAYATNIAASQLTDLQKTTEQKMADLFGGSIDAVNVFDFGKVFDGTFESLDKYVQDVMIPLQEANIKALEEAQQFAGNVAEGIIGGLEESSVGESVDKIVGGAIEFAKENQVPNAQNLGTDIGENVTSGIGEAMSKVSFSKEAQSIMSKAVEALQIAGEIHSPSELMKREVGVYLGEGIAAGLVSEESKASIEMSVLDLVKCLIDTFFDQEIPIRECAIELSGIIRDGITSTEPDLALDIENIAEEMLNIVKSIWTNDELFTIGSNMITWIQNGVLFIRPFFLETIWLLVMRVLEIFYEIWTEETWTKIGQDVILWTDNGMKSVQNILFITCYTIARKVVTIFKTTLSYNTFFYIGMLAMMGLARGIISQLEQVKAMAQQVASETMAVVRNALDIHSPSRKFYWMGQMVSKGFALGIRSASDMVSQAGTDVAESAMNGANQLQLTVESILESLQNYEPDMTITPSMDLSRVHSSIDEITTMFNKNARLSGNAEIAASVFESGRSKGSNIEAEISGGSSAGNDSRYTFNQYNYSPKALSRIDIYRATQKQINQIRGVSR